MSAPDMGAAITAAVGVLYAETRVRVAVTNDERNAQAQAEAILQTLLGSQKMLERLAVLVTAELLRPAQPLFDALDAEEVRYEGPDLLLALGWTPQHGERQRVLFSETTESVFDVTDGSHCSDFGEYAGLTMDDIAQREGVEE